METFGERLRHARLERGYSQGKLARACKLSQSAISSYENGHRRSPLDMVALAQALRVDIFWLSTGQGHMDGPTAAGATPAVGAQAMRETPPQARQPEVPEVSATAIAMNEVSWPFPTIDSRRFWALPAKDRQAVEAAVSALIDALLAPDPTRESKPGS